MELTRRQRNEIFEALQAKGVDPGDCELAAYKKTLLKFARLVIRHAPTNSMFELGLGPDRYEFSWHVHEGPTSEIVSESSIWKEVLDQLGYWAQEVQYVNETPDLWAELKRTPQILAAVEQWESSNEPFTADEQAEISNRLDEVKQLVREKFELTDGQLSAMDRRLDDVKEAAKHSNRKTWLYTFYGAVMSTFMTDEIPPHVIQTIVTAVLHGISHLFGIGGPPPVIPA